MLSSRWLASYSASVGDVPASLTLPPFFSKNHATTGRGEFFSPIYSPIAFISSGFSVCVCVFEQLYIISSLHKKKKQKKENQV